jgi:hypothetical protein
MKSTSQIPEKIEAGADENNTGLCAEEAISCQNRPSGNFLTRRFPLTP